MNRDDLIISSKDSWIDSTSQQKMEFYRKKSRQIEPREMLRGDVLENDKKTQINQHTQGSRLLMSF